MTEQTNGNSVEKAIESYARQSFDPRPEKRIEAAKFLEQHIKSPSAVYILMELTHDRDHSVRRVAKDIIDRAKGAYISETVKKLDEQLFESLQKSKKDEELVQKLESVEAALLDNGDVSQAMEILKQMQIESCPEAGSEQGPVQPKTREDEKEIATFFDGIKNLDMDDLTETQRNRIDSISLSIEKTPIYRYLWDFIQKFNPTPKAMKDEMKRIVDNYKRDVKFAVDLAWYRHRQTERELTVSQLKPGMKKVNIVNLSVVSVSQIQRKKGKKFLHMLGVEVRDSTGNITILIEPERGEGIRPDDVLELEKAIVLEEEGKLWILLCKGAKLIIKR